MEKANKSSDAAAARMAQSAALRKSKLASAKHGAKINAKAPAKNDAAGAGALAVSSPSPPAVHAIGHLNDACSGCLKISCDCAPAINVADDLGDF